MLKTCLIILVQVMLIIAVPSVTRADTCGDGILEGGELCDIMPGTDGGVQFDNNLDCTNFAFDFGTLKCDEYCVWDLSSCSDEGFQLCGNGLVEPWEECDDPGSTYCSGDCKCLAKDPGTCGNGCKDVGEECDDGNSNNSDRCLDTCKWAPWVCGNSRLDPAEECDDGVDNSDTQADKCRTNCELPSCGDSVTDTGEECDDGSSNSNQMPNACRTDCTDPSCGDGVIDTQYSEECDNGAANSDALGSQCNTVCLIPRCGNGYIDPGETCDDGNIFDGDGCSGDCNSYEICGNGIIDYAMGEECDDSNTADGDGCSASCAEEDGWSCLGEPSVCSFDPEPDAGTVEPDAGTVEPDAGTVEPDAGTVEPDAGTVEPDAGTVEPDAGEVEPDAGTVEPDAGTVEPDAGEVQMDGAAGADAGVSSDGGGEPDETDDGGCGCRTGGSAGADGGLLWLALLGLVIGFRARRRRRRR